MKNKVIISLAVFSIFVGAYGLSVALTPKPADVADVVPIRYVKLWELKSSAKARQALAREQLSVRRMKENEANELGYVDDVSLNIVPGMLFRTNMKEGALVTADDFIRPNDDDYVDFIVAEGKMPYRLTVVTENIVGTAIESGDLIDILAFTGLNGEEAYQEVALASKPVKGAISVTPIFAAIKVLRVETEAETDNTQPSATTFVLEMDRKQAVTLTLAKRIATLEIQKSLGQFDKSEYQADAGDILHDFDSIVELRADKTTIN